MNEKCWVLVGKQTKRRRAWVAKKRRRTVGSPTSVEADWRWVLARDESHGDVVGFFHTHPDGAGTRPSARDIRTMGAWSSALGKPLLCLIADGETVSGYVFANDESANDERADDESNWKAVKSIDEKTPRRYAIFE